MAKVVPLFSGSQGNSYYIAKGGQGILIDAGRSAKQITSALTDNNIELSSVKAIFVTHEHIDHVKGVRVLANRHNIPVYSTVGTQQAMLRLNYADEKTDCRIIGADGIDLDTMRVDCFPISHDCAEGCGYKVDMGDVKFALATDLGYLTEDVANSLLGCDTVVIESNHDVHMLELGPYPYYLKRRILSKIGHLSNNVCAELLPKLVRGGTKRFVLAHLSRENNMPELAYQESLNALVSSGMTLNSDFTLDVAPVESNGLSILF